MTKFFTQTSNRDRSLFVHCKHLRGYAVLFDLGLETLETLKLTSRQINELASQNVYADCMYNSKFDKIFIGGFYEKPEPENDERQLDLQI